MLEGAVARILNQLLGKYVVDLDTENLNVGIFSGAVQLRDLKLKAEALYELRLPIQVRAGTIGKINLQIPWSSLWSQPIIVNVDDILILCKPIVGEPFDSELNKRLLRGFKKQTLEAISNSFHGIIGGPNVFSEHLLSNIVNNVQLVINNVHVRYECYLSNVAIAVGLCIGSITSENTNSKWKSCPIGYKSSDNLCYHLVKFEAVCAYCNGDYMETLPKWDFTTTHGYYHWKNTMSNSLQSYAIGNEFNFFLRPMSIKLKLTITKDHGKVKKISTDCIMHDLNIHLEKNQCTWLSYLYDSMQRAYITWDYLQFRPGSNSEPQSTTDGNNGELDWKPQIVIDNYKSWWQYAYKAVLLQRVHPYTWSQIRQVRQNQKLYLGLYEQHLLNPNDTEIKLDLQQYEDKLNITNIIIARHVARLKVRTESVREKSFWDVLPSPEKQLLCERIGFISQSSDVVDNIEYEYNFRIGNTCLALTNGTDREVLVLTLTQFISSYKPGVISQSDREDNQNTTKRPSSKGSIKIEGIIIEGANRKDHLVPVISSNHEGRDSPAYFLRFDWERYPEDSKRNHEEEMIKMRVNMVLEQLEFVYDKYAFEQIMDYIEDQYFVDIGIVGDTLKAPRNILNCMDKLLLDNWEFNLVLNFPYFVITQNGTPQNCNQGPILIIDLGQLILSTELCQPYLIADNATQMELEEQMYSKYLLEFKNQQILFIPSEKENWKAAKRERDTELHLMPKMSSTLTYFSCIKMIKTLAEQKLNWNVQNLRVNLSEKKVLSLIAFVEAFDSLKSGFGQSKPCTLKTNDRLFFKGDEYKGIVCLDYLRNIQSGIVIHDKFARKRKHSKLAKQPTIIDKKIEFHEKNANVNEAWARFVDLPGLEDNISPSNTIKMIFRVVFNEFQISYSRSSDTTDSPYLNLRLGLITLDLALMSYGPAYQFSMGSIILTDKMHTTASGQYLDVLHSPFPSSADVFAILYRKVSANCPDYWSHFHGVETSLVADLGTLYVMLHQEAVRTMIQYWKYILNKIMSASLSSTSSLIRRLIKAPFNSFYQTYFATTFPVPTGSIKYSQSGRLGDLNMQILDSDFDILNVNLQGFELDFLFRANERFVVRSFLSSINVEHLSNVTLYKKVLYTDEDKVFELKYVRFADLQESEASNLKFHLGQLNITLLYKLLVQSHRFMINLDAGEYCQKLFATLHGFIENATESLKTNTKMNLSVNVKGPVLLIPEKSSSPNVILVDTGNLSIENFFKDTHRETIENILVKVSGIFISRGVINLDGTLGSQETIMEPLGVHLDVKRIIPKIRNSKAFTWEVDGLVETINVTIGQKDIMTLLAIYADNKSEYSSHIQTGCFCWLSQQISIDDESVRNLEVFFAEPKRQAVSMKLSCDGINIGLFFESAELLSSPIRDLNHGLAKLQMNEISFCCIRYSDASMGGKLSIDSLMVEEIGPDSNVGDHRILYPPLDENKNNNFLITVNKPPIVDLTFHRNRTLDKSADIIIGRLALTLSVPFIEKVALFVIECVPKEVDICGVVNHGYVDAECQCYPLEMFTELLEEDPAMGMRCKKGSRKSLTIALRINKPEFIFLIEGASGKRRCFVTKAEILSDYARHSQRENFVISLSGLHTIYCSSQDSYIILRQCDVELAKSFSFEKGEKWNLSVSSLYFQFSNKVFYAFNDILNDIAEHFKVSELTREAKPIEVDIQDLWEPRKVILNHSTKEIPSASNLETFFFGNKLQTVSQLINNHQVFLLPKTEFLIVFELETLPVLIFKSTLELTVSDWSSLINSNCDFTIQGNYFNAGKDKWEPFIDPVVIEERVYIPWDLNIKVFHDKSQEIAKCKDLQQSSVKENRIHMDRSSRPKRRPDASGSSEEVEDDESGDDMVYLEPTNSLHGRNSRRVKTSLSTFLDDSDSENDDGSMEKLAAAISDLFTGDWNESDESDIDNSTDSDPDQGYPETEEHRDSSKTNPNELQPEQCNMQNFQKTLHLLIDCKNTLHMTMTPALIKTLTDLVTLYSNKTLSIAPYGNHSKGIDLVNDIGPKSKVEIYEKEQLGTPASRTSESDCRLLISKTYENEDSCPNSPSKEALGSLVSQYDEFDYDRKSNLDAELSYDFATVNSLDFTAESTTELYEKINRYQMRIFIPHFYGLQTSCPRKDAQKLLRLHPRQVSTTIYYLTYKSTITKHGMSIVLSSPFSIRNETCFALSILYQPSVLQQLNLEPVGDVTNPFDTTMRIAVLEPLETYNVPIHIAYHCKLFIQPAYAESQYMPSQKGVWWKDLATDMDTGRLLHCQAKNNELDVFSLRVVLQKKLSDIDTLKHTVPNYIIRLLPAIVMINYLPYAITVDLLSGQTATNSVKIEPGEKSSYYNVDTSKENRMAFKLQTYQQFHYIGGFTLSPHLEEKVIAMIPDSDRPDINGLPLNIKAECDDYYRLLLYTTYWIVNKTHLPMQLKATSTNTIFNSNPSNQANEDIILFSFKRHTRQTIKLKVYDSEFSNEFGLDSPGITGLIVCKDIVRKKKYSIWMTVTLSEMYPMTKIITFLPCFQVRNLTDKILRFMEHNEKTDLWIDLHPNQELPFWPETSTYQMYVKLQEQKSGNSQAFYFSQRHKTLLKLEKVGGITVTVTGGVEQPFYIIFSNYHEGDAPVLIKNTCPDLFLKIRQQGLNQVTLLSPQHELVYTWDDPCKNRSILWNIYNNKSSNGFILDLEKSMTNEKFQYGQERIHFGTGDARAVSSSEDSDSSMEESIPESKSPSKGKNKVKSKEKLTIYWIIYKSRMFNQRTLLFTQDVLLFNEYLQVTYAELSTMEVLLSLNGFGLSLFTNGENKSHKEHLYISLNDCPAAWEVNVGHKWKTLTLELASWIEDKYKSGQKRCQLKDYVHIDFEKMFMLKPFFAELRRSYNPAIYLQYRHGTQNQYLNLKVQNIQIDNKSLVSQDAIVLSQVPLGPSDLTKDNVRNPFLTFSVLKAGPVFKCIELDLKDLQINLQSQLLIDLQGLFPCGNKSSQFRKDMSKILNNKTKRSKKDLGDYLLVEQILISSTNIVLNVQSSQAHGNASKTTINRCQAFLFPINMTPYMPAEGVKHKILNLDMTQLYIKNPKHIFKVIGGHFKSQFLQQYYAQVLGLQVLLNPYAITQTISPPYSGYIRDVGNQSTKLLYSLRCLLGHVNMSAAAVEQCIFECLSGQHNFPRRPTVYHPTHRQSLPKIINWNLRNFNPGVILALNQIIASKSAPVSSNGGQSDGEIFFRGTGKALVSLLTRHPDDKSNSVQVAMEALKRASLLGEPIRCHRRLTRYGNKYRGLGPYSIYDSMGNHLLETVAGGRFRADTYWTYAGIDKCGRSIIIVTLEHVLRVNKCRLWGAWDLEWSLDLDEIISVPKVANCKLAFNIHNETERHRDNDLAANSDGKLLVEGEEEALEYLQSKIEQAIVVSMEDKSWTINETTNFNET